MNNENTLPGIIADRLPSLDSLLAAEGVPLSHRPFQAAIEFVQLYVLDVRGENVSGSPDLSSSDLYSQDWFRAVYRDVEAWYERRYGPAFTKSVSRTITGLVVMWDTAFEIQVPISITRPGTPGKTIWLSFPDTVLAAEDPTLWLPASPNLDSMRYSERAKFVASCRQVASLLRSILVSAMGIPQDDSIVRGFLNGLRINIEAAAEHPLRNVRRGSLSQACWNVQLACEFAYKALLQQTTGSFIETHDLFVLHDRPSLQHLSLHRDLLKRLPRWERMVELRYGQGEEPSMRAFSRAYLAMLQIVATVLRPIVRTRFENAAFEIGKAPWLSNP